MPLIPQREATAEGRYCIPVPGRAGSGLDPWMAARQERIGLVFPLEAELTGLGRGWAMGGKDRRLQSYLPVFWLKTLGGRWCHFLRWGRHREEQAAEEMNTTVGHVNFEL